MKIGAKNIPDPKVYIYLCEACDNLPCKLFLTKHENDNHSIPDTCIVDPAYMTAGWMYEGEDYAF